ncbi:MAG TPA: hypothetical protein VF773_03055 [Verrucomicrobiae bacterium]
MNTQPTIKITQPTSGTPTLGSAQTHGTAPKRRMRRTPPTLDRNPNLNPSPSSSMSSASSAVNSTPSETHCAQRRRHRARPFEPLPEFAALTKPELERIHELLRTSTLAEVQAHLLTTHQIDLTISTLHRYRSRLDLAEQLQLAQYSAAAVEELLHLFAGRATALSTAARGVVLQRSLGLVASPSTSPSLLIQLHRLFTYEDRREAIQHRIEMEKLREQTRSRHAVVAEQRQRLAETKYTDPRPRRKNSFAAQERLVLYNFDTIPPVPVDRNRNLHDQTSPPIDPPNSINGATNSGSPIQTSRAAINETTAHVAQASSACVASAHQSSSVLASSYSTASAPVRPDETTAASADQNANSCAPSDSAIHNSPSPSVSLPSLAPQQLADQVSLYTVARLKEFLAHQDKHTPWAHRHSPPEYRTAYHHCPCGNQTPCPIHESPEFGPFPDDFWKISPKHPFYAACLRERNLPFRFAPKSPASNDAHPTDEEIPSTVNPKLST